MPRALASFVAALALAGAAAGQAPRVVAVGDIHGDFAGFTSILRQAGLVDASNAWVGGGATLIQTGDSMDRGADVRAVLDLLMALEGQAKAEGGRVQALLGNHEVMNLMGETRDANPPIYETFADANSTRRRDEAWADYQKLGALKAASGGTVPAVLAQSRAAFVQAHPPGYIEYREALGPRGTYGRWLRDKPMVLALDGSVFLHAGIPPAKAPGKLAALNDQVRDEVRRMDRFVQRLVDKKLALPFFTLQEVLQVAIAEVAAADQAMVASQAGDTRLAARLDVDLVRESEAVLAIDTWLALSADRALWWRGLATEPDDPTGGPFTALLARYGAVRFVTGHTPTATRRIVVRFGGRAVLIDTGMNKEYYQGHPSALEIAGDRLTAIYLDRRETLTP